MPNRVKLEGSTKVLNRLKKFDSIMIQSTEFLRGEILKRWLKATGADDRPMPVLTAKYLDKKKKSGRKGIRDLNFTGKMQQGLYIFSASITKKILRFRPPEMPKARGNVKHAPGMMSASNSLEKKIQQFANKSFWSGL